MKIYTGEQLVSHVDDDFAWRFFELSTIQETIRKAPESSKRVFIRAGIAILYAHWEGFVKNTAETYLRLVSASRLSMKDLENRFVGLAFKNELARLLSNPGGPDYGECIAYILDRVEKVVEVPYRNVVKTQANLSSTILRRIVQTIGLDYSAFELKEQIIDGKLLYYRNAIAHGSYLEIDEIGFEDLMTHIRGMLKDFKEQVFEAARTRAFAKVKGSCE